MTKAIVINQHGGPEVLSWEDVSVGKPNTNELRIKHTAIGLNFIDTYHRAGLYPVPLPMIPGLEAVGIVEEVGEGVSHISSGDRVAYPAGPVGAYSQSRLIPADKVVTIPSEISDQDLAALLLKGCTVEFLVERLFPVQKGQTVLFHAASGGVGSIACQWLKSKGVTIIGTVGSDEKAENAQRNGCHHTINYTTENFKDRVMEITDGKGVPVVYDSVGAATFMDSLDCLSKRGTMVTFGNATGPVPPVAPGLLAQKGSLMLTRPILMDYVSTPEDLNLSVGRVVEKIMNGDIKANIKQNFALEDAARAHTALEARETSGQTILIP